MRTKIEKYKHLLEMDLKKYCEIMFDPVNHMTKEDIHGLREDAAALLKMYGQIKGTDTKLFPVESCYCFGMSKIQEREYNKNQKDVVDQYVNEIINEDEEED